MPPLPPATAAVAAGPAPMVLAGIVAAEHWWRLGTAPLIFCERDRGGDPGLRRRRLSLGHNVYPMDVLRVRWGSGCRY